MNSQSNFIADDSISARTRYKDLVVRIWPFLKKYRYSVAFLVTVVLVHTSVGRFLPVLLGKVVDNVIIAGNRSLLVTYCAIYFSLEVLRFIFVCVETYFFQKIGLKVIYDMRGKLFSHVQTLPIRFFDKTPVGRVVTRITNDFSAVADLFTAGLVSVFVDTVSLVAILIAMLLIDVKLTLIVMSIAPLMLWSTFYLSGKARDSLRVIKKKIAALNSFIAENISGMKVTQLYAQEAKLKNRFDSLSNEYRDDQLLNIKYLAWLHPVLNGFNAFTVAMALYYSGILSQDAGLKVGLVVAFLMNVQDFLPPLRNILEKYQTFQASLASCERIFTLFDQPAEDLAGANFPSTRLRGKIELKNVQFAYEKSNGAVLKGVNLTIQPGENVAIVGATGSGKSTIIGLLQRFYDFGPDDLGQILIDGEEIRSIAKADLRRRIGVVQQDFFLFRGSILSNITLSDPKITREQALLAAKKAHCGKMIAKRGLEGIVQEKGSNLSVGEKQLIGFARILAFDPDILILDEATAHIDSESEALIQQATKEATTGRTSIIIAHRLSTIVDCHRIFVLDKGLLVEFGSHEELLKNQGVYQKLYQAQMQVHT